MRMRMRMRMSESFRDGWVICQPVLCWSVEQSLLLCTALTRHSSLGFQASTHPPSYPGHPVGRNLCPYLCLCL